MLSFHWCFIDWLLAVYPSSSAQQRCQCSSISVQALPVQFHYSAGTDVGRGSFETTGNRVLDIMSHTWDEYRYLPRGLSAPRIAKQLLNKKNESHLGMPAGKSPSHAPNPLLGEWRKTLLKTHHALSPHLHVIICTSFISSIDCTLFDHITLWPKCPYSAEKWRKATTYYYVLPSVLMISVFFIQFSHEFAQYFIYLFVYATTNIHRLYTISNV